MNKNTKIVIRIIGVIIIIVGSFYFLTNKKQDAKMVGEKMDQQTTEDVKMSEEKAMTDDKAMQEKDVMKEAGSYEAYSGEKVMLASNDHNVVLFFRASWCPSCIGVDKNIKANLNNIPSNLHILDVNYDNSSDLKKKYGVTYQHTFVQVDKDGNMIKKWSGSPTLASIISEVK